MLLLSAGSVFFFKKTFQGRTCFLLLIFRTGTSRFFGTETKRPSAMAEDGCYRFLSQLVPTYVVPTLYTRSARRGSRMSPWPWCNLQAFVEFISPLKSSLYVLKLIFVGERHTNFNPFSLLFKLIKMLSVGLKIMADLRSSWALFEYWTCINEWMHTLTHFGKVYNWLSKFCRYSFFSK